MENLSLQDVAEIVESEGLGYAVTGYMSHESIADKDLKELWKQASEILSKIENILEPYMF